MEVLTNMSLATKLVSLRKENGLTQIALAEKLDVSRQAISSWEVGKAIPGTDKLKLLCDLYGVSIDYLLNEEAEDLSNHSDVPNAVMQNMDTEYHDGNKDTTQDIVQLRRIVYIGTVLIIVLLATILSTAISAISPDQSENQITPIEDLTVIEDDDYPSFVFPFD